MSTVILSSSACLKQQKHSRNSCFTTRYIAWTPALIKILSKCCLNFGQERRIRILHKEQKAQKYKMCCFKNRNPHVAPWTARNPKTPLLMPAFLKKKTGLILNQTLKRSWHAITALASKIGVLFSVS